MLTVTKETQGAILIVKLVGAIEESVNFEALIGPVAAPTTELHVNCKGIPRINSVGVKAWLKYFQSFKAKNIKVKFLELSTAIVEQMNFISNFKCGGEVDSLFVPFSCEKCNMELVGLFKTDMIKKLQYKMPPLKCTKCGGNAVFDDVPKEYFGFMME